MKIDWTEGECEECGDEMKVARIGISSIEVGTCKQCQLLAKFERIAYALEMQVGIS